MKIDFSNSGKVEYDRKLKSDVKSKYVSNNNLVSKSNTNGIDTLEISPELKKLQPIISRYKSGFYEIPEVVDEVAKRLEQELFN